MQSSFGQKAATATPVTPKIAGAASREGKRSGEVSKFVTKWEKQTLCPRVVFCLADRRMIPAPRGDCRIAELKGDNNSVLE